MPANTRELLDLGDMPPGVATRVVRHRETRVVPPIVLVDGTIIVILKKRVNGRFVLVAYAIRDGARAKKIPIEQYGETATVHRMIVSGRTVIIVDARDPSKDHIARLDFSVDRVEPVVHASAWTVSRYDSRGTRFGYGDSFDLDITCMVPTSPAVHPDSMCTWRLSDTRVYAMPLTGEIPRYDTAISVVDTSVIPRALMCAVQEQGVPTAVAALCAEYLTPRGRLPPGMRELRSGSREATEDKREMAIREATANTRELYGLILKPGNRERKQELEGRAAKRRKAGIAAQTKTWVTG